jgi:hypothetical protein
MPKIFTCAICGYIGECRPEEEALAELKEEFGDIDPEDCSVVCDDCWEKISPKNNPEIFDAWENS